MTTYNIEGGIEPWAEEPPSTAMIMATEDPGPTFAGEDIADLSRHVDEQADYLVSGLFTTDQPIVFGARSKCLKTTKLVDLTVALATGTKWLGAFEVPRKRRVLFITGESNKRAISKRLSLACQVRGRDLEDLTGMARVEAVEFPKINHGDHRIRLAETVENHEIELVIIDPLFRGIGSGIDTNKLNEMADMIVETYRACQPAAVIIAHHTTKAASRELEFAPRLEDLSGAGVAESFGSWWLVGRNEEYGFNGLHDMCVTAGNRDGDGASYRLLFDERDWTAEVTNLAKFIDEKQQERQREAEDRKREKAVREGESIRAAIQKRMRGEGAMSQSQIKAGVGYPDKKVRVQIAQMIQDQSLVPGSYTDSRGRQQEGWRLSDD